MTQVTEVYIKAQKQAYYVPTSWLEHGLTAFNLGYKPGCDVAALARAAAADVICYEETLHDRFARERLARCILSLKARKPRVVTPKGQQELPFRR
jgi:hypothetical protein